MARQKTWQDLILVSDLDPGDATPVKLGHRELAVYDGRDGITVSYALCTHGAAMLCDGYFDGRYIECPLHQGLFDTRDGAAISLPARKPLRMVECRLADDMVQVLI